MGDRIAYFGSVKLGTELLSIDSTHERQGRTAIAGIDQARVKLETRSPNFLWTHRVWTQEVAAPASRTTEQLAKDLLDEMVDLEDVSDDNILRPLVWIEDAAKATTVSGVETAGATVQVEIASLSTLGAVAGDYVFILGSTFAEVCLVSGTHTSADYVTLATLANNLAGGEAIILVSVHYPSCRYDGQDPGRAEDRSGNRVRFRKSYVFTAEAQPLWRA